MSDTDPEHRARVVDQFSRQAGVWSAAPGPGHEDATGLLLDLAGVGPADEVLDAACGAGQVGCAAATRARRVVGVDLTPAMVEQARARQAGLGLTNAEWHVGDAAALPFPAGRFDAVLTRYSLHHAPEPGRVVSELARVARPGGRVTVADLTLPPEKGRAYDAVERLRDPSHVRVLAEDEVAGLLAAAGLFVTRYGGYRFELGLAELLTASFPRPGEADRVRDLFERDAGVDRLGVGVYRRGGEVRVAYPITIVVARKPAAGGLPGPCPAGTV
jgi:SAM-dependent methyltransferase